MFKKLLFPVFLICAFSATAQFNNSWIDYSKTYYKFKLGSDILCRIPQSVFNASGLAATNADHYQLWRNGQQVRLFTSVTGTVLGGSDYVEFFGEMNDGKPDKELYLQPQFQLADRYSLETDTAVYFLTVNPAGGNLRYTGALNPAPGAAVPDAYFMRSIDIFYRTQMNRGFGKDLGEYVYSSAYDNGEGFTTADIPANSVTPTTYTETISGLNVYTAGPPNSLSVRAKTFGNTDNSLRSTTLKVFNTVVGTSPLNPLQSQNTTEANFNFTGQPISLLQNTSSVQISITNSPITPGVSDRIVVATLGITYPAVFNFNNQRSFAFELAASATGNYLLIDNFNYGSLAPVLYDITSGNRYVGDVSTVPGKVGFLLPPSAVAQRKFILNNAEAANINFIPALTVKNFINYNTAATRGDYIIISNPIVYNDANGVNQVEQYRQYRSSVNGGAFNAKTYDINELSDQFAFGIKKHPASIRDFVRFMDVQYPVKPKAILLLGRGMTYIDQRNNENHALYETLGPVPTFGWPASDILLVSQPGTATPITPVGRLGAINGTEVANYLLKVTQYEAAQRNQSCTIADKAWMKNSMNIVGGSNQIEANTFGFYMDQYKAIFQDTLMGGKTETFLKTSVATIQQASSARISELFREGLGVISYFGHSSSTVFEFNLSTPEQYDNTGKYPFFNVSGCTAGNYYTFDPQRVSVNSTLSDKYIFTPQKGSIGFLASTHFGIPFALHNFNHRLYKNFSTLMYGQRIGDQIKEVTSFLGGGSPSLDYYSRIHVEEINLHGDPAIKINNFPKPDYVIEDQTVKISPSIISVADASFNVKIGIRNIGRAINDSIRVIVKRLLPNTTVPNTYLDTLLKAPKNADSLNLNLPISPLTDKGQNRLIVEVDWTNRIAEICETNNTVIKDFFIFEDDLRPIYPYNFGIINTQNTTFSASTANPLVGFRNYVMEMDTTELFNSAFKKTYTAAGVGGLIQFTPTNLVYTDSTVYYWRTAVVPSNGNYIWNNASFVYLPASTPGFNQSHYYQHLKSQGNDISLAPDRQWKFGSYVSQVKILNGVFPTAASAAQDFMVDIDGAANIQSVCGVSGIILVAINPVGMTPMSNGNSATYPYPGQHNSIPVCGASRKYQFQYNILSQAGRDAAANFLNNVVPVGWYVVVRNISSSDPASNTYAPTWQADPGGSASMYNTLKNAGFTGIDQFTSPRAFNFMYKKADASFNPIFNFSVGIYDKIELNALCPTVKSSGKITSPVFGPTTAWGAFHWRGKPSELNTSDSLTFDIIGVTAAGTETTLYTIDSTIKDFDISSINAIQYPYLKLRMYNKDSAAGTPYQLRYWRVNYAIVPEGAIAPNLRFTMKDTVEAGEHIDFSVAFRNVTPVPFTALMKVKMRIRTATNFDSVINISPLRILAASPDTIVASYRIPTEVYPGNNSLFIEFNPNNDQPEQFHFNNMLYKDFYVKADLFNPLLDVTFDGVHILSRDIVASKPNILIKLKDESRFMALKDTALVKVQLRYPDQSLHTYYFNGDTLRFIPADLASGENSATIEFKPTLPEDGEYELIVSGKDASGNPAGNLNYRTVFTVINKPMISEMLNYPNPFTTSTAFVFTLTGSRVPQNLRIQVLTITGKVVREITKEELGPIHVGRNISEFKWDGTDMYGQKLANGVYIYRVITNLEGKSLDKYKAEGDNTDKFFNKGYGKMYLMR